MGSIFQEGSWGDTLVPDWMESAISTSSEIISSVSASISPEGYAPGNDLAQDRYDFRSLVFPNDIGMDYVGHYMVININVPTKGFTRNGLALLPPAGAYTDYFTEINQVSKVDTLRYGAGLGTGPTRSFISIPRQTRRIAESIALFMPSGLYWYQENLYEDVSMTEYAGKLAIGASELVSGVPFLGAAAEAASGLIGSATDPGGIVNRGAAVMRNPINPAVEILFSTTKLRSFTFDFLFAPRNEQESINMRQIMSTIKFHGSPELNPMTGGATWIPPGEFDITIFNKGVENLNIARINTCVLNDIEIDYHPSGIFSTFKNGHPVQARMRLTFREVEPMHKQRVLQGF